MLRERWKGGARWTMSQCAANIQRLFPNLPSKYLDDNVHNFIIGYYPHTHGPDEIPYHLKAHSSWETTVHTNLLELPPAGP